MKNVLRLNFIQCNPKGNLERTIWTLCIFLWLNSLWNTWIHPRFCSIRSFQKIQEVNILIDTILWKQGVKKCVEEVGIGFMLSPNYHSAMNIFTLVRKKLGVMTVFNILGPMLNPAQIAFAVVGVCREDVVTFLNHFPTPLSSSLIFTGFFHLNWIGP